MTKIRASEKSNQDEMDNITEKRRQTETNNNVEDLVRTNDIRSPFAEGA